MKDKDINHLKWVYDRMKFVHNENEDYDYMIRFSEIIYSLQKSIIKPKTLNFIKNHRCPKHRNK